MAFIRTKEISPGSGNYYAYRVWYDDNGNRQQEYLGPAHKFEEAEVPQDANNVPEGYHSNNSNEEASASSSDSDGMNEDAVKQLTRQGSMVGKDAAEIITMDDVQVIQSLEATPMYVSEEMLYTLREGSNTNESREKVAVKVETEIPEFMGVDGETYPASTPGEEMEVPKDNAEILVNRGNASYKNKQEQASSQGKEENQASGEGEEKDIDVREEERGKVAEEIPRGNSIHKEDLQEIVELERPEIDEALDRLKRDGVIYEPKQYHVQRI